MSFPALFFLLCIFSFCVSERTNADAKLLFTSFDAQKSFSNPSLYLPVPFRATYSVAASYNNTKDTNVLVRQMQSTGQVMLQKQIPNSNMYKTAAGKYSWTYGTIGLNSNAGKYTCDVQLYNILSPIMKQTFENCVAASFAISDNGNVRALVVYSTTSANEPPSAKLIVYKANAQVLQHIVPPLSHDYTDWEGTLRVNSDGSVIAMTANRQMLVFLNFKLVWNDTVSTYPLYTPSTTFAISGDGQYLAYAWQYLTVLKFSSNGYAPFLNVTLPPNYHASHLAMAGNYGTYPDAFITVASVNTDSTNIMLQLFNRERESWRFETKPVQGSYHDAVSSLILSDVGSNAAIGMTTWGDANGNSTAQTNPTIYVFSNLWNDPVFSLRTNGSVTAMDMIIDKSNVFNMNLYLHAIGLPTHIEAGKIGSEQYAFELPMHA